MAISIDAVRPLWLSGLNEINGVTDYGLVDWLTTKTYSFNQNISLEEFWINIPASNEEELLRAFAFECNRFASTCFESLASITEYPRMPKSTAWILIKLYYSSYFAAHSILRIFGISHTKIDGKCAATIASIADINGFGSGLSSVSSGYYSLSYDQKNKVLHCLKTDSKSGAHENFWFIFKQQISNLSTNILSIPGLNLLQQETSSTLDMLCSRLCLENRSAGQWLSYIRNCINYRHDFGTWFPYKDGPGSKILNIIRQKEFKDIEFAPTTNNKIETFADTCLVQCNLLFHLINDINHRCPEGKSFLHYGAKRFLNQYMSIT